MNTFSSFAISLKKAQYQRTEFRGRKYTEAVLSHFDYLLHQSTGLYRLCLFTNVWT